MTTLRTDVPTGAMAPSVIDNYMRDDKTAWQERLDVDHDFTLAASAIKTVASGGGKHKKVTLPEIAVAPTPGSNEGAIYAFDVSGVSELFYNGDGFAAALQLTSGGLLNVTIESLAPVIDGETLYENGSNLLAVQLDDDTLEYDATAKVRCKAPAAGDSNINAVTVHTTGTYTGQVADLTIDTGINFRLLTIMDTAGAVIPCIVVRDSTGLTARLATGSLMDAYVAAAGSSVTLDGNTAYINDLARTYRWVAVGERV